MGKEEVLRYSRSLRDNLRFLQSSLRDGSWEPSPFKVFTIFEPKERVISAAPFCDRVAHHAVMTIVGPIRQRCACLCGASIQESAEVFIFPAYGYSQILSEH